MKRFTSVVGLAIAILLLGTQVTLAEPADDAATCNITCTVGDIMEWEAASFSAIDLGTITSVGEQKTGSSSLDLYTNGDVSITADNTATAQIASGGNTLTTEYSLSYDGDGTSDTGGSDVSYAAYDTFLGSGSTVTHVAGDGAATVTLGVRATAPAADAPDSGSYSATQTLTAAWSS